jgi:hypothetical protein
MYRAHVSIQGTAPLSQSRQHRASKLDGESHDALEERTWREKCNYDSDGVVFVPAMALKQAVDTAAKRLAIPDPDNKRANLTKYFVSDVICESNLSIGVHKDEMPSVTINADSEGKKGSMATKRVPRILPQISEWEGQTSFLIMEEKIKEDMFKKVLAVAGQSIGVGQFRPERGGLNGRFEIKGIKFEKITI